MCQTMRNKLHQLSILVKMKPRFYVLLVMILCELAVGTKKESLHWKLNKATADGFTNEANSSANNRGLLSPGTSIITTDNWLVGFFNGNKSGILISNVTDNCFISPGSCQSGLSISFHIKWPNNLNDTGHGFVIASRNFSIYHTLGGKLITSLWNGTNEWLLVHKRNSTNHGWTCYIVTWDRFDLKLFVNRTLAAQVFSNKTKNVSGISYQVESRLSSSRWNLTLSNEALSREMVLGNNASVGDIGIKMHLDDLKIWNDVILINETKMACARYKIGGNAGLQQQPYKYPPQVHSSLDFANKALKGYVVKEENVASISECIEKCRQENCKSFNIGQLNSTLLCEVNSAAQEDHVLNLIDREDYYYYDVYWGT